MVLHLPLLSLLCLLLALLLVNSSSASARNHQNNQKKSKNEKSKKQPQQALPAADELLVQHLEDEVPAFASFQGRMYAGSLPMDHVSTTIQGANPNGDRTGFLQFWLFVPDVVAAPGTMVSWFNGGPGCSSFSAGVLFEHSPVTVPLNPAGWCCEDQEEPLVYNRYAWTNATVVLYVEQPIGVGFSEATHHTPPPSSEDDVAADFDAFLQNFYKVFNGYSTNNNDPKSDDDDDEYDPSLDMGAHKLYLVGESYAGIYIPSVARAIYLNNVKAAADANNYEDRFEVPLAGIAIGNGKMDALTQDPAVIDFAYWHGLIDGPTRDFLFAEWNHCVNNLQAGRTGPLDEPQPNFHPFSVRDDCGVLGAVMDAAGAGAFEKLMDGPNIYEYSTWDPYAAADGADGTVTKFYNNPAVQNALNVPKHRRGPDHLWEGCLPESEQMDVRRRNNRRRRLTGNPSSRRTVESKYESLLDSKNGTKSTSSTNTERSRRELFMDYDTPWSVIPYVAQLLDEARIDVLIYSGDRDIICCTQGSEESLRKMEWSGTRESAKPIGRRGVVSPFRNAWTEAPRGLWIYNDYPAGYTKSYKNLNLLTVYNAGHMVPYNQPGPALDMMTRFLKGESFHDRELVSFASSPMPDEWTANQGATVAEKTEPAIATSTSSPFSSSSSSTTTTAGTTSTAGLESSLIGYQVGNHNHNITESNILTNGKASTVLLAAVIAFLTGYIVARWTNGLSPSSLSRRRNQERGHGHDSYGSINPESK